MKETTNEKAIYSVEFDFAKGTIELEAVRQIVRWMR